MFKMAEIEVEKIEVVDIITTSEEVENPTEGKNQLPFG